jgi:serine/threonine protein kinase
VIANRFLPLEPYTPGTPVRARDQQTAQTVVLHPVRDFDRGLAGVFHPGLFAVFDVVEHDGLTLAACEYAPARSLPAVLGGDRCHPRRAREIVGEVADGVAELHARGLCHGAITVDSVWLTAKGKSRLTLVDAVRGGSEAGDVRALVAVLDTIAAGAVPPIETDSAAVLSALLRA